MFISHPSSVYLAIRAITAFANATMFTTYAIYFVSLLGLDAFGLTIIGTALEASVFFFEIPTGVVADMYSRRLSIIIGMAVMGLSHLLSGSIPFISGVAGTVLTLVLIGEVLRGFGYTFTSGALSAWLTEEVGKDKVGPVFVRASQVSRLASILGIGLSVLLAGIRLNLPYIAGGTLYLALAAYLTVCMQETGFRPATKTSRRSAVSEFMSTLQDGLREVRGSSVLVLITAVTLVVGAGHEGFTRLWPAFILNTYSSGDMFGLTSVQWFGIIRVVSMLLTASLAPMATRYVAGDDSFRVARALLAFTAARVALMAALGLSGSYLTAICALLLTGVFSSLSEPLLETWTNRNISGRARATILSMMGQTDALGQMTGGPIVGLVGVKSLRTAILLSAALVSPAILAYGRMARQSLTSASDSLSSRGEQ